MIRSHAMIPKLNGIHSVRQARTLSIIKLMKALFQRLGSIPYLLLGAGLLIVGLLSLNHIVNSFWPIDVQRIDLVRATALDQADPAQLLNAANREIIWVFLAGVLVVITGASFTDAVLLAVLPFGAGEMAKAGAAVLITRRYRRRQAPLYW